MRTQICNWFDTKNKSVKYGVQVWKDGRWQHVIHKGKPAIFDTEQERDECRAELRKIKVTAP